MRFVCISDTHNYNQLIEIPDGDLIIHSGDATNHGTEKEIRSFLTWFSSLPHQYKIFVAGNHDWLFESDSSSAISIADELGVIYLEDSMVEIGGVKIYGSPWQPRFYDWAFNLNRGSELQQKWQLIPEDTEVLITHGPPFGILDEVMRINGSENAGCKDLLRKVVELSDLQLKKHVFGHIHEGYGRLSRYGIEFLNASTCNEAYEPVNEPIVFEN